MPARWAVYARVSTEEQARLGYSLAAQLAACRERALALGATEVLEFADEGAPGDLLDRPALARLRAAVRAGAVAGVVVYDPDRLARDLAHQLLLTEEIEGAGVRLEFVNFEWRNTAEGRLFYAVRGAIAEYEKAKIRQRTLAGLRRKMEQGLIAHYAQPYGYRYQGGRLHPDPDQAEWVRCIFTWAAAGVGPAEIARRLGDLGAPAPGGGAWHRQAVARILRHPVYKGEFFQNRTDQSGMRHNRFLPPERRRRRRPRPPEEWVRVPVPALVSAALWEAAQAALAARGRPRRPAAVPYLLAGLARCALCGRRLRCAGTRRPDGRRDRYYACPGRRSGCPLPYLRAEPVEDQAWAQAWAWLLDPAALALAAAPPPAPPAEAEAVQRALRQVQTQRRRALRLALAGALAPDEAAALIRDLDARLQRLRQEAAALGAMVEGRAAPHPGAGTAACAAGTPAGGTPDAPAGGTPGAPAGGAPGAAGPEALAAALCAVAPRLSAAGRRHVLWELVAAAVLGPGGQVHLVPRTDPAPPAV